MPTMEDGRIAFEEWADSNGFILALATSGDDSAQYVWLATRSAFAAWSAALEWVSQE